MYIFYNRKALKSITNPVQIVAYFVNKRYYTYHQIWVIIWKLGFNLVIN